MIRLLRRPLDDVLENLDRNLAGTPDLVLMMVGLVVGWWIYVPIHELLHAFGCLAAGGTVTRLEISPEYGGALLAGIFDFVHPESEYAGRLSGFDTHGSDFVYLVTVFAPYLLTLFPGVWAMRRASRSWLYGFALPFALAPFLSLIGDAYEIGSIVATWIPMWSDAATREILRGDDVFKLVESLRDSGASARLWIGAFVGFAFGTVWAWKTYLAGRLLSDLAASREDVDV